MKTIVTLLLLSVSFSPLFAQFDKIHKGVQKTHKGYYDEAIPDLEAGLSDLSVLTDKDKAKAYTHLAISYLRAGIDPSMKGKFKDPFLQSLQAINKAEAADKEKAYKTSLASIKPVLQGALFNDAVRAYNANKLKTCITYAEASTRLDPKDYTARALLGLALLGQKKNKDATTQLEKAISIFQSSNKQVSQEIATAYSHITAMKLQKGEAQEAQKLAKEGIALFRKYPDVVQNLTWMNLIAYEKSPNPLSRGRKAFEAAIKKYPEAYDIQRTYAALLIDQGNETDQAKGYAMFQKMRQRLPKDYEANAYLARKYIAEANQINSTLDPGLGDKQYKEIEAKVTASLAKAYPHVRAAYDQKPEDEQWLSQLVSISSYVPAYQGEKGKWLNAQQQKGN